MGKYAVDKAGIDLREKAMLNHHSSRPRKYRWFLSAGIRHILSFFSSRPNHIYISPEGGFTYLMTMFFVVMMGISLMVIGQEWSVTIKRDREAELVFRGTRIKEAIERYAADYEVQKATRPNRYPQKLIDLTKKPHRYLQTVYKDPITGEDFDVIKIGAEIHGVRSTSQEKPYDRVNFKDAKTYHAVRFEASGQTGNCAQGVSASNIAQKHSVLNSAGCGSSSVQTEINPQTGKPFENLSPAPESPEPGLPE
ncbi:MAG: hypothetical protein MRJ96_13590 [Nitrospirales bacterium]|nr:hypothetical protein [Nitrospira sp.]MDR4502477.1 hypothetical protein [Nitrospirales bacterium]